ncbi:putative uncharacterized protein DDB_G0282129 isoform X1 [Spodoptera frugiperda]|uniref:Uncharacterized protein n=1 Tax=Spodoptera frugiperda TaxID=7108 RepID=A0A9R0EK08_SPOFR|nr:putative uncharacterized protein DDB_G0282129 isoform X1 [Spodoptera frugiperda]
MPPIKRRRQRKTKNTTKSVLPRRTFATWLDDTVRSIRFAAGTVHTAKTVANTGTSPISTAHDLLQSAANSLCTAAKSIRSAANLVHASSPSNDPSARALCARLRLSANWLISAAAPLRSSPPSIHDALQVAAVALRKAASSLDTGEVQSMLRLRDSSRREPTSEPLVTSSDQVEASSSSSEQRQQVDQENLDRTMRVQNEEQTDSEPRAKLTKSEHTDEHQEEPIASSSNMANNSNKSNDNSERSQTVEEVKEEADTKKVQEGNDNNSISQNNADESGQVDEINVDQLQQQESTSSLVNEDVVLNIKVETQDNQETDDDLTINLDLQNQQTDTLEAENITIDINLQEEENRESNIAQPCLEADSNEEPTNNERQLQLNENLDLEQQCQAEETN